MLTPATSTRNGKGSEGSQSSWGQPSFASFLLPLWVRGNVKAWAAPQNHSGDFVEPNNILLRHWHKGNNNSLTTHIRLHPFVLLLAEPKTTKDRDTSLVIWLHLSNYTSPCCVQVIASFARALEVCIEGTIQLISSRYLFKINQTACLLLQLWLYYLCPIQNAFFPALSVLLNYLHLM